MLSIRFNAYTPGVVGGEGVAGRFYKMREKIYNKKITK